MIFDENGDISGVGPMTIDIAGKNWQAGYIYSAPANDLLHTDN